MEIEFIIPLAVKPKQSFRASRIRHHPNARQQGNQIALAALASQHRPPTPYDGPVEVAYEFRYPWKKTQTTRTQAVPKFTRPDLGNLEKQMDDVLEAAGFVTNDSRIAQRRSRKVWHDRREVWVFIRSLEDA